MILTAQMQLVCLLALGVASNNSFSANGEEPIISSSIYANSSGGEASFARNINLQNAVLYYKFPVSKQENSFRTTPASAHPQQATASDAKKPHHFILYQNYPNPFNERTFLKFELDREAFVDLSVFSASGFLLCRLIATTLSKGLYIAPWDGSNNKGETMSSGVYYARLECGDSTVVKRMVLLR